MAILSRQIGWSQESNLIYELLRELNRLNGILGSSPLTTSQLAALPVYADNAAALAGGLTAGQLYRTSSGVLMVTY